MYHDLVSLYGTAALSGRCRSRPEAAGSEAEGSPDVDLNVICKQMGRSPDWMPDILLRADGYETDRYRKD